MRDIWRDMWEVYRKMGLSEEEIAKRMLCKTAKVIKEERVGRVR